jgi:hypothetical protein
MTVSAMPGIPARQSLEQSMATRPLTSPSPFRARSGWIPLLMSAAALALLAGFLATGPHDPHIVVENGIARQDEGAAARVWQLLMALQLPVILLFAVKWLPRDPKRAVAMLALQGLAFVAAALPVFLLEL